MSVAEECVIFMTRSETEVMLKKEKEKTLASFTCLDLKLSHSAKVATKPYLAGYVTLEFQKFDGRRGNTCEHFAFSSL